MTRLKWRSYLVLGLFTFGVISYVGMDLGDVIGDGMMNLPDAESFIDSISTVSFDPKITIDQNGEFNLRYEDPFNILLKGK